MEKETLTIKQLEILYLLYRFRHLSSSQIQKLLKHSAKSKIKSWLNQLSDLGYTIRYYSTETLASRITPARYSLNVKALLVLKNREGIVDKALRHIYNEKVFSDQFRNHCLIICDYYLHLQSHISEKKILEFFTANELVAYTYLPKTDAYFTLSQKGQKTKRYFFELLDLGLPRFVIRNRIRKYITYGESMIWEENVDVPFPQIVMLCPDEKVKKYVAKLVSKAKDEQEAELIFNVITYEEIH